MTQFEKYHPLLTEHYTLDWLTSTPLKTAYQLLPKISSSYVWQNFSESAQFLNQTMLKIMRNEQLVWGITRRASHALVGVASLTEFNSGTVQLKVAGLASDEEVAQVLRESLTYLTAFSFAELNQQQINLVPPFPPTALLTQLGYSYQADGDTWQIQRAVDWHA